MRSLLQGWAAANRGLRAHLLGLVVLAVLPALAIGALAVRHLALAYHEASEERLRATARGLALALDADIATRLAVAQVLAAAPSLVLDGDLQAFDRLARTAGQDLAGPDGTPARIVVSLPGPDYRRLINTALPWGAPLPSGLVQTPDRAPFPRVFATGRPVVSDMEVPLVQGPPVTAVFVPVWQEGRVVAALAVVVDSARIAALLASVEVAGGGFAGVLDGQRRIMARSAAGTALVGERPAPAQLAAIERDAAGLLAGVALDGTPIVLAWQRLARADWVVAVALPAAALEAAWQGPFALLLLGGLLLLALGLGLAALVGRRLLRPVLALARAAEQGRAALAAIPPAPVREVEALRHAMLRGAEAMDERAASERRAAERQRLLAAELSHRVKNALAVVQAIAHLTLARSTTLEEFRIAFEGRLQALARAHGLLLRRRWEPVGIDEVVEQELAAWRRDRLEIAASGPPLALAPPQGIALGMILHEFATNAAKHGALATPGGRVELRWALAGGELVMRWEERGAVPGDGKPGFGTRLIRQLAQMELGGSAEAEPRATGMAWRIAFPLEAREAAVAAA